MTDYISCVICCALHPLGFPHAPEFLRGTLVCNCGQPRHGRVHGPHLPQMTRTSSCPPGRLARCISPSRSNPGSAGHEGQLLRCDRPLTRSFHGLRSTAVFLVRAGFLVVWIPLSICRFGPVLAHGWHDQHHSTAVGAVGRAGGTSWRMPPVVRELAAAVSLPGLFSNQREVLAVRFWTLLVVSDHLKGSGLGGHTALICREARQSVAVGQHRDRHDGGAIISLR
jgi:hypothetical protein